MPIAQLRNQTPPPPLKVGERLLSFGDRSYLMGVVNVTPDSFSDGGDFFAPERAVSHAIELVDAGADIIDIGGESTRPGAEPVPLREELRRVIPVIAALRDARPDVFVSIDTYKARVAQEALEAGADIVNDISSMTLDPEIADVVATSGVPLIAMHILGDPKTMQSDPVYDDVVTDVTEWLRERVEFAERAGIERTQIVVDPGIGFGKTVDHNYQLLRGLDRLAELGRPILLGTSRKSFIGAVIDKPASERVWGTAATVAWGALAGAQIFRVHDVAEMLDVTRVADAIRRGGR